MKLIVLAENFTYQGGDDCIVQAELESNHDQGLKSRKHGPGFWLDRTVSRGGQ